MNDRIAELETARLSCEADEDAALRLQEKLARLRATVAQTRCGSPPGQDRSQGQGQGKGQGSGSGQGCWWWRTNYASLSSRFS